MTRVVSPRRVLATGLGLLALWALSFALSYASLGGAAMPVAIGIALAKAALVALFFMELVDEPASVRLAVVAAVLLAIVLGGLMVADVLTRGS